jgi:hypothetical protein
MEIKTCEEYVLNELKTLQEKLTKVNEENEELKKDKALYEQRTSVLDKILKELYLVTKREDCIENMTDISVVIKEAGYDPIHWEDFTSGIIKFKLKKGAN